MINASNINPKVFAQYDHQITDNECTTEELNLPGYDLVTEANKGQRTIKNKRITQSQDVSSCQQ